MTEEKDDNDANENDGKIHLVLCRAVPAGSDMCKPVKGTTVLGVDNLEVPDCLEDSGVEINQKCNG